MTDELEDEVEALRFENRRIGAENTFLRHQLHEIHAAMEAASGRLEKAVKEVEKTLKRGAPRQGAESP